tara:strand:+ start:265 stop:375 length:111 start_codon:yes stop_codon:yes gene_type:complete
MKHLLEAVKKEFDLWKKRRAYFKRLEKEFKERQGDE